MDDLATRRAEDRLRAGLTARADLLDPPDRLTEVLAAAGAAHRRRWVPLAAAAAVAAVVTGTVWAAHDGGPDDRPRPTTVANTPSPSTSPSPSPAPTTSSPDPTASPTATPASVGLPVYVIAPEVVDDPGAGLGLRRTWRSATVTSDEAERVRAAVDLALDADVPGTAGSPWAGVDVSSVRVDAAAVTVTVSAAPRTTGGPADALALPQVGWTAQAVLGRGNVPVTVVSDGRTLGTHTRPPADRWFEELTDVWVTAPRDGAVLPAGRAVVVRGEASVFEAALSWELSGSAVREGTVTASAGAPTRGTYAIDLGALAPGSYRIRVVALSPKDGSVAHEDTVAFEVR